MYALTVRAGADSATVPFAVQGEQAAPILVVLPAITWFGADLLDDDRDGVPNTLENGSPAGTRGCWRAACPAASATRSRRCSGSSTSRASATT